MDEAKLYAEVVKRRSISDAEWEYLHRKGYVQDAALKDFEKEAVQYLVSELDELPHRTGRRERSLDGVDEGGVNFSQRISEPFSVELSDTEAVRAKVLLEIQVREASADLRVTEFRERHLDERQLTSEQAEAFLSSPGSRELDHLSSQLARDYDWHIEDASWWVLTGEAPLPRPVRVGYRWTKSVRGPDAFSIEIQAPPWISAETIKRAFLEMRRIVGETPRPLDSRILRVLRFVEEQKRSLQTEPPTYQAMLERWNREHPAESYPDYRTFRRAYKRAFQNVVHPPYNMSFQRKLTPNMERQRKRREKEVEYMKAVAEKLGPPTTPTNTNRVK